MSLANAVLPNALLHENPPTRAQLLASVDPWIPYHLKQTIQSIPRFEHMVYGQLISYLASILPHRRRFMTIPQFILRRTMQPHEIRVDRANVSTGSTGGLHESRNLPGAEHGTMFPDFVTVKVTPLAGLARDHRVVCLIEVKKDGDSIYKARDQMWGYMEQIIGHPNREPNLYGFLVLGAVVEVYRIQDEGFGEGDVPFYLRDITMFDAADEFTNGLCDIAIANWN
ncbi:hypothetical protein C8J56DRAFT_1156976 [Mycena floridula]|nr:hypothetical protein C8J56DRAFT_1156976 [Mycena floridula]